MSITYIHHLHQLHLRHIHQLHHLHQLHLQVLNVYMSLAKSPTFHLHRSSYTVVVIKGNLEVSTSVLRIIGCHCNGCHGNRCCQQRMSLQWVSLQWMSQQWMSQQWMSQQWVLRAMNFKSNEYQEQWMSRAMNDLSKDISHESFVFTSSTFTIWRKSRTKASFLQLQLSVFEGSLARKLRCHIFK